MIFSIHLSSLFLINCCHLELIISRHRHDVGKEKREVPSILHCREQETHSEREDDLALSLSLELHLTHDFHDKRISLFHY